MKKLVILFFLSFAAGHIFAQNEGFLYLMYDGELHDYVASDGAKGTRTTKISVGTYNNNSYLLNVRLYNIIDLAEEDTILLFFKEKSEIQSFLQKCLDLYEIEDPIKAFIHREESSSTDSNNTYAVMLYYDHISIIKYDDMSDLSYYNAIPKLFFEKALKMIE